jgi:hypothetical protein
MQRAMLLHSHQQQRCSRSLPNPGRTGDSYCCCCIITICRHLMNSTQAPTSYMHILTHQHDVARLLARKPAAKLFTQQGDRALHTGHH